MSRILISSLILSGFWNLTQAQDPLVSLLSQGKQDVIIIGETHSSASTPKVAMSLIKDLNNTQGKTDLILEAGISEAFFYQLFLDTGNEKYLDQTIMGGNLLEWGMFWKNLYEYNSNLPDSLKIKIQGVEFEIPAKIIQAINVTLDQSLQSSRLDSFRTAIETFKGEMSLTIFPSKNNIEFLDKLTTHVELNKDLFDIDGYTMIMAMLKNPVTKDYKNREHHISQNILRILNQNDFVNGIIIYGQSHVDFKKKNMSYELKKHYNSKQYNIIFGLIKLENSEVWKNMNSQNKIMVNELSEKPYKKYRQKLINMTSGEISFISFKDQFLELGEHSDFIIIAQDQDAMKYK